MDYIFMKLFIFKQFIFITYKLIHSFFQHLLRDLENEIRVKEKSTCFWTIYEMFHWPKIKLFFVPRFLRTVWQLLFVPDAKNNKWKGPKNKTENCYIFEWGRFQKSETFPKNEHFGKTEKETKNNSYSFDVQIMENWLQMKNKIYIAYVDY